MHWVSECLRTKDLDEGIGTVASKILAEMEGKRIDLVAAFLTPHFTDRFREFPDLVRKELPHNVLIGCSANGVVGGGREIEQGPGLSITAAQLPGIDVSGVSVLPSDLPDLDDPPRTWRDLLGVEHDPSPSFIILGEPFSFNAHETLAGFDYAYPGSIKIGGIAGGARRIGDNILFVNGQVHHEGLAIATLSGPVRLNSLAAHGCRPIGGPMHITRCRDGLLFEVNGTSPLEAVRRLVPGLPEEDRQLLHKALFLGVLNDELATDRMEKEFLIRTLIGQDPDSGAFLVGDRLREGQTIQFHLRDPESSTINLSGRLSTYASEHTDRKPSGALIFINHKRGTALYDRPEHDTRLFREHIGRVPLGGFFGGGEIGPVKGATHLHGHSTVIGMFHSTNPLD